MVEKATTEIVCCVSCKRYLHQRAGFCALVCARFRVFIFVRSGRVQFTIWSYILYDIIVLHIKIIYFIVFHRERNIVPTQTTWRALFIGVAVAVLMVIASFVFLTIETRIIVFYVLNLSIWFTVMLHIVNFMQYVFEPDVGFVRIRIIQVVIIFVSAYGYMKQLEYVYKTCLMLK